MSQYQIAVIVGSLRKDSINRKFADALIKLAPADFTFNFVQINDLPLYNQDEETTPPPSVTRFKSDIKSAHGVLFVTPEYNRSIPGVVKNLIDHGSRPYSQGVWSGKPAGVMGVSPGAMGTAMAQQHLRNILAYLDMPTLGQPEAFIHMKDGLIDENGNIGEASLKFIQNWMDKYTAWVKKYVA
jgi:chromate reductase